MAAAAAASQYTFTPYPRTDGVELSRPRRIAEAYARMLFESEKYGGQMNKWADDSFLRYENGIRTIPSPDWVCDFIYGYNLPNGHMLNVIFAFPPGFPHIPAKIAGFESPRPALPPGTTLALLLELKYTTSDVLVLTNKAYAEMHDECVCMNAVTKNFDDPTTTCMFDTAGIATPISGTMNVHRHYQWDGEGTEFAVGKEQAYRNIFVCRDFIDQRIKESSDEIKFMQTARFISNMYKMLDRSEFPPDSKHAFNKSAIHVFIPDKRDNRLGATEAEYAKMRDLLTEGLKEARNDWLKVDLHAVCPMYAAQKMAFENKEIRDFVRNQPRPPFSFEYPETRIVPLEKIPFDGSGKRIFSDVIVIMLTVMVKDSSKEDGNTLDLNAEVFSRIPDAEVFSRIAKAIREASNTPELKAKAAPLLQIYEAAASADASDSPTSSAAASKQPSRRPAYNSRWKSPFDYKALTSGPYLPYSDNSFDAPTRVNDDGDDGDGDQKMGGRLKIFDNAESGIFSVPTDKEVRAAKDQARTGRIEELTKRYTLRQSTFASAAIIAKQALTKYRKDPTINRLRVARLAWRNRAERGNEMNDALYARDVAKFGSEKAVKLPLMPVFPGEIAELLAIPFEPSDNIKTFPALKPM